MSFCAGFFWAWLLWGFKTLEPFGLCPSTFGFLKAAFSPNSFGLFLNEIQNFFRENNNYYYFLVFYRSCHHGEMNFSSCQIRPVFPPLD